MPALTKTEKSDLERASALIGEAMGIVQSVRDEAQDRFDDMSEKVQEGDRGQELSAALDTLNEADDTLSNADGELSSLLTS